MTVDPYNKVAKLYDRLFEPLNSGLRAIGMKVYLCFALGKTDEGLDFLETGYTIKNAAIA